MNSRSQAPYAARLVVLLGEIARRALTGRILLSPESGEDGGWLRFQRGALIALRTAATREPMEASPEEATAVRKRVENAVREAARLARTPRLLPEPDAGPAPLTSITAADLALDVVRLIDDAAWLEQDLGGREALLAHARRAPGAAPRAAFGSSEGFLLSRADGTLTVGEIVATAPLAEIETLRGLHALRAIGLLDTGNAQKAAEAPAPAPAARETSPGAPSGGGPSLSRLEQFLSRTAKPGAASQAPQPAADEAAEESPWTPAEREEREALRSRCLGTVGLEHYAILGVERSATESQIRTAYYKLAKQYHPDRLRRPHLEDMFRDLEGMFAAITLAYNTLSNAATRSEYDTQLHGPSAARRKDVMDRPAVARDAYLRGRKAVEAGELFEAVRLFETAVENDPSRAEYFHLLGACQGQNPRWRKKAEENLKKALSMNPGSVATYIELARIYRKGGLERRCLEMYQQALRWDPTHKEALAETTRAAGDAGGSGLLRSLFHKD